MSYSHEPFRTDHLPVVMLVLVSLRPSVPSVHCLFRASLQTVDFILVKWCNYLIDIHQEPCLARWVEPGDVEVVSVQSVPLHALCIGSARLQLAGTPSFLTPFTSSLFNHLRLW